jgi:hypothetical protein
MDRLFDQMGDSDGHFVQEFQGLGFHARLFELACFAYLQECGYVIQRNQRSPDFLAIRGSTTLALEAVTSNPPPPLGQGHDIAISEMSDPETEDILAKCDDELPIRVGSGLVSKLRRSYWERQCCQGVPLLLIVAPFHEPGSQTYIDESLARYLFGIQRYNDWTEHGGILVREASVLSHRFGNKAIPSKFFMLQDAENISGVVWANQFTVSKFLRMAAEAQGLPRELHSATIRGVRCWSDGYTGEDFEYTLGDLFLGKETWHRGVTICRNPNARIPLPENALPCTSTFRMHHDRLIRDVHGFHTLVTMTFLKPVAEG